MKKLILLFVCFLIVILESTLLSHLRIGGIIPNLTLITVMSVALCDGSKTGRHIGFFMGLTQDVLFFRSIGYYALLFYLLGHLSGIARRVIRRSNMTSLFLFVVTGDLAYGLINYVFLAFLHGHTDLPYYLHKIIIPEAAYTSFFILPLYCVLAWLCRILEHLRVKDAISHNLMRREEVES
ncbi:MAG: rod shape-determining protein MreD [Clostridiales bacterium]|nr:rod shape-determining protein MreD [Clostridiales bacterium]